MLDMRELTCCTRVVKMVVTMNTEKMTFCMPASDVSASKKVKPMNKPAAMPSANLAKM
jgi:hypothetical protein